MAEGVTGIRAPSLHRAKHASGGSDALTGNLDATARVAVDIVGGGSGTRRKVRFIGSLALAVTVADDAQNELVTVTPTVTGKFPDNIVLPKTAGKGIRVDTAAPTFGFADILACKPPSEHVLVQVCGGGGGALAQRIAKIRRQKRRRSRRTKEKMLAAKHYHAQIKADRQRVAPHAEEA